MKMQRLLLLFLLSSFSSPMFAATTLDLTGVDSENKTSPQIENQVIETKISIASIPLRADNDERTIRAILKSLPSEKQLQDLNDRLENIASRAKHLDTNYQANDMAKLPIRRLESLERHLQLVKTELKEWRSDLQLSIQPLSAGIATLAELKSEWTAASEYTDLPPPLLQRVKDLLKKNSEANTDVSDQLSTLLNLEQNASPTYRVLNDKISEVTALITRIDFDLTRIESPNLFEAIKNRDQSQVIGGAISSKGMDVEAEFSNDFYNHYYFKETVLSALSILLFPILIWLSRLAKQKIAAGMISDIYTNALTRPISAWFLLVAMSVLIMDLHGPFIRLQFWLLLAWIPVMRLMPKQVSVMIRPWMTLSAVFFSINLFSLLITSDALLFRLTILANSLLMMCTMAWVLYHLPKVTQSRTIWQRQAIRALLLLGISALAISIAANIIGNVSLAAMLTDATLNSSYIGMFITAVATVIEAFITMLFSQSAYSLRKRTHHAGSLIDVGRQLFSLAMLVFWMVGTLDLFRILRPITELAQTIFSFTFKLGNISVSLGGIALFFVLVYLSFWIAKTLRNILAEDFLPSMELQRGVANSVSTMSYYVLLMAGLTTALAVAGFQFSELAIVLGALSVGIGIGLQDVVKNFVSGLILMIERPVQPGDTIELSGTVGKVLEIGIRATTLSTANGADVVVPNGMLLAEKMTNWTLSNEKRRFEIQVGVAYGNDPEAILALLTKSAQNTVGVCADPPPSVLFSEFGASSLDFTIRAWANSFDEAVVVRSNLALNVHSALKQAGIEIPFPQQDLHIKTMGSAISEIVSKQ